MKIENYLKSIAYKNTNLITYFFLATLRVILVCIPQSGYIHPDEFFQSVEILGGKTFDLEVTRTWEFNTTFPIRSIAVPYVCLNIPLIFFNILSQYIYYYFNLELRTSYMLLVVPRLVMCALSFINDYSLYKICLSYNLQYDIRLIALASSYVMLVFGTRTFSNTFEMALCSILLYYVSECMVHSNTIIYQTEFLKEKYHEAKTTVDRVKIFKLTTALPSHSFNKCLIISTLCVTGVFNRPTFLIFGMPIVFFWLHRGMGSKIVSFLDFNLRMAFFIISAIPSLIFFILVDSIYYGYLTMEEIEQKEISLNNFVITPLNFIKYNMDPSKTGEHGVHPKYIHLLVNIPLLFNILGIISIFSFGCMLFRFLSGDYRSLPRAQSVVGLMTSCIFVPIAGLSFINHQEPRFLIPTLLPIILLHAPKLKYGFTTKNPFKNLNIFTEFIYAKFLCSKISSKYLLNIWFTINIFLTLFFGFLHQGGVYQLSEHFSGLMQTKSNSVHVHLITSHIYMMPQSFLLLPNSDTLHINPDNNQKYRKIKQFHLYEYGSINMNLLYKKLKLILDVCEMKVISKNQKYQIYLAIPSSLTEELNLSFYKSNITFIKHTLVKVFYPHLSIEAMPQLFVQHPCEINTDVFEIDETCAVYDDNENEHPYSLSYVIRQFSSIIHQFGLTLYKIEFSKMNTKKY